MKLHTGLFFLHWYLVQTYLPDPIAGVELDKKRLAYAEKGELKVPTAVRLLYPIKVNNVQYLLIVGDNFICWLSSANYPHCLKYVPVKELLWPSTILAAPEKAFSFPAVTISHKYGISAFDISDIQNIKEHLVIPLRTQISETPVWINSDEFLIDNHDSSGREVLLLFKRVVINDTEGWENTTVKDGRTESLTILKDIWNSFDVLYARMNNKLHAIWAESEDGSPGNWLNKEQIKENSTSIGNTRELDLVHSTESKGIFLMATGMEMRAYEIPLSSDFKKLEKYNMSALVWDFNVACRNQRGKPFFPHVKYQGKPWILVHGCNDIFYIKPSEEEPHLQYWNYKRKNLSRRTVRGQVLATTDLDQDGFTELYVALESVVKVFHVINETSQAAKVLPSDLFLNSIVFTSACLSTVGLFHGTQAFYSNLFQDFF